MLVSYYLQPVADWKDLFKHVFQCLPTICRFSQRGLPRCEPELSTPVSGQPSWARGWAVSPRQGPAPGRAFVACILSMIWLDWIQPGLLLRGA
jgi:hypothetical protein